MGVTVLGIQHNFYPRSPCGERHIHAPNRHPYHYFYPRSPCGERRPPGLLHSSGGVISIHALLAESDVGTIGQLQCILDFYPRSPCGERRYLINTYHRIFGISIHALLAESDLGCLIMLRLVILFLSTLSLRRATRLMYFWPCGLLFLSTLSLRRAT